MVTTTERSAGFSRLPDWLAWQETLHPSAVDLGLERLERTLARLAWQRPPCPIITVGGTNGKGSSVALAASILREGGYRVGTFTSPHLVRYNERIAIGGREVSDASLIAAFERIDAARGEDTLTFFEFNTLAALLVFESAAPDALVLEVGMGGRLDAVNIVDADAALVTSIALDHCDWLGHDREAIGREKAGIWRPARPAVFGARDMPDSVAAVAREQDSELKQLGRDFDWSREGGRWTWRGPEHTYQDLPPPALSGEVQYDNASAVLTALHSLAARLPLDRCAIERGLETVRLPGRFQVVMQSHPLPLEWIIDVAHNPAAARTLAAQLADRPTAGRTIAVCGILADKDIEGVAAQLRESFDIWIVVGLESTRAVDARALAERLARAGAHVADVAPDVTGGCAAAEGLARPGDRIVVFGSFLAAGPALELLAARGLTNA